MLVQHTRLVTKLQCFNLEERIEINSGCEL